MPNPLLPLNYAVLQYFTSVDEASTNDVMQALKKDYATYRQFKPKSIEEVLMTATVNGLMNETGYDLDENGELRTFYTLSDYGYEMVEKYIDLKE